jgi:hypothetical protein
MPENPIVFDESSIHSRLSFKPLVKALKKSIAEGNPGVQKLYGHVLSEIDLHPDLLEPIEDLGKLIPHTDLIEELLASIFPPTSSTQENLYAISLPFKFQTVYTSRLFHHLFIKPGTNEVNVPDSAIGESLNKEKMEFAYGMILRKYCGYHYPETTGWVHPYHDPHTGLTKYMELKIDTRFVDVNPSGEMPELPNSLICQRSNHVLKLEELIEQIPLDKFIFEGLSIVRVHDVTEQEVISRIKNTLININVMSDASVYVRLENYIQSLIALKDVKIGITPFFKINNHYVYSDLHNNNSLLFRHFRTSAEKDDVSDSCKLLFRENDQPVVFETLDEKALSEVEYLQYYYMEGGRSLIICPLKQKGELLGILEIMSESPGLLKHTHVTKIDSAIHLFTLGLEKTLESLNTQIDRVIKKQFTAVQPAVEWKFTDVALNFIVNRSKKEDTKIERIAFNDVYPLYGSIDIRNSSTERSHAIQLDFIEQLQLAQKVVKKVQSDMPFPLLQEIEFKIEKYIGSASDVLQSDEEMSIREFMQGQVVSIFNHLHGTQPSVKNEIELYFSSIDPQVGMLYHHRKEYEQSISKINDTLARFIDKEQQAAQKVYPHYFERYVTDGLEFNIYIGQSISPRKKFDEIYLRNLKMWQLTVLAKAARVTHALENQLPHSLRTTQLILAHSQPLSISFRTEERKFDVDGAYNIRYEIVKKRIDKVRIKDSNERLTQPGMIGIVYSQPREATEYMEYIEFLQSQKLLKEHVDQYELEELQGVSGLKALRVAVNFDSDNNGDQKPELSNLTSQHLLGKG